MADCRTDPVLVPQRLRELAIVRDGMRMPLAAASGLVRIESTLYVIADDAHDLGVFALDGDAPGVAVRLFDGELPAERLARKKHKPDLEALVRLPPCERHPFGALLALGSGSRPNRCRGALLGLAADGMPEAASVIDLSPLYARLRAALQALNIEGALVAGPRLLLLQRGNDEPSRTAAIALDLATVHAGLAKDRALAADAVVAIEDFDLGGIGSVRRGFSDGAALPDGRWVFAAIAEDTRDSYLDGACTGSAIGVVDADGRLAALHPLQGGAKIEGIDARIDGDAIEVLLVTDADDPDIPAQLLRTRIAP